MCFSIFMSFSKMTILPLLFRLLTIWSQHSSSAQEKVNVGCQWQICVLGVGEKTNSLWRFWKFHNQFRVSFLTADSWHCVRSRNSCILLASNSIHIERHTHTHTIPWTFHKIIFYKVWKGWNELQGHLRASLHRICTVKNVLCYTNYVRSCSLIFQFWKKCSKKA